LEASITGVSIRNCYSQDHREDGSGIGGSGIGRSDAKPLWMSATDWIKFEGSFTGFSVYNCYSQDRLLDNPSRLQHHPHPNTRGRCPVHRCQIQEEGCGGNGSGIVSSSTRDQWQGGLLRIGLNWKVCWDPQSTISAQPLK
jgi:hypothetical protein